MVSEYRADGEVTSGATIISIVRLEDFAVEAFLCALVGCRDYAWPWCLNPLHWITNDQPIGGTGGI